MNELTPTRYNPQSSASSDSASLTMQLAKMMALVAPVTMSSEQQEIWLRGAADALQDIRADEVDAVSLEVRRSITRPAQIVPKIAELVAARRSERSRVAKQEAEYRETLTMLPAKRHIMDRKRDDFTAADWAELNEWLESQGSAVRYSSDGTKLAA